MLSWRKKKSEIELLEKQYACLMKRSFKAALHSKTESDRLSSEAYGILQKLREVQSIQEAPIVDSSSVSK